VTWHLTLHRWTEGRERSRELLEAHLSWMREQQRSGRVLIAGPTPDLETGIVVFGHASGEEVDRICATEPFIAAGLRRYERIPWDVHHLLGVGGFDFATVSAMAQADARADAETPFQPTDAPRSRHDGT
jgi:uncharacterized protein YciI